MKKPVQKLRPSDPNMRMKSILDNAIAISNRPILASKKTPARNSTSCVRMGIVASFADDGSE